MTPDELWEKYGPPKDPNSALYAQGKIKFLAALAEYGQHIGKAVRDRDAEICEAKADKVYDHAKPPYRQCAAAIEATPLP